MSRGSNTTVVAASGFIEPGVLYRVSEVKQRLGLGEYAWKKVARGLRAMGRHPTKIGQSDCLLGDDLIAYLARQRELKLEKQS